LFPFKETFSGAPVAENEKEMPAPVVVAEFRLAAKLSAIRFFYYYSFLKSHWCEHQMVRK